MFKLANSGCPKCHNLRYGYEYDTVYPLEPTVGKEYSDVFVKVECKKCGWSTDDINVAREVFNKDLEEVIISKITEEDLEFFKSLINK